MTPLTGLNVKRIVITLSSLVCCCIREWSLITGRGIQNGRGGGQVNIYPYKKWGGEKVLAMLKEGQKRFWGSFNTGD